MEEKALYLLAQFDRESQRRFEALYRALADEGFEGRQTKNIPYHFTLGQCDPSQEDALKGRLDAICAQTDRIEIWMDHIGLFGAAVLFLEPNMNFELLGLRQSFFPQCGSGCHPWAAHATLLLDERDEILRALPVVIDRFKPFRASIDSVGLYEFFPARFIRQAALRQ